RTAFPFLALREVLTRCIAEFESCFSSCLCLQTKTIDPKRARCLGFLLVCKRPVGEYSLYLTLEGLEGSQTDRRGGFRPGGYSLLLCCGGVIAAIEERAWKYLGVLTCSWC